MSIITSSDPDHLDIYGTPKTYRESFEHYTSLIEEGGALVIKKGLDIQPILKREGKDVRLYTYGINDSTCDFYAYDIKIVDTRLFFSWHYPSIEGQVTAGNIRVELGVPLMINVENATAAMALALLNGVTLQEITKALFSFRGVARRFEKVLDNGQFVLIDDYAHHPKEIEASINSVKLLYKGRQILGIFQPHLYSRTRDFYKEFAYSLSKLDNIILLDIYPAREAPIEGICSEIIAQEIKNIDINKQVIVINKEELIEYIHNIEIIPTVVLMLGAGDIDRLVSRVSGELRRETI